MARQRDQRQPSAQEQFWRDMLLLWRDSGQSVRAFCATQGLSEPSFYAWRRTLAQRQQQLPAFVPLRVMPTPTAPPTPTTAPPVESGPLELVLGRGRVVRVTPGFDADTLRHLLAVLEEGPSC